MAEAAAPKPASPRTHLYGGQAVVEGVMMRGAGFWAIAVRRPDSTVHVESHEIDSVVLRYPLLGKPFFRGIIVLGQSLAIGMRALMVSANQSLEEEERLTPRQVALSIVLALALFIGIFIIGPTTLFAWFENRTGSAGILTLIGEGVFRVGIFVAYLWLIGKTKDIHRVFEYHGAEHKTIAAFEHGEELQPELIDRYPKEHVRCGTNFLIIVMIITIFVFTLFGTPALVWRIVSRVIAIPIIAAISYEALRFGAKHPESLLMRSLMKPGIWLQRITTQPARPLSDRDRGHVVPGTAPPRGRGDRARSIVERAPSTSLRGGRCIGHFLREDEAVPTTREVFPMPTSDLDMPLLPSAEQISRREFATVRRGYDPQQVRAYLTSIANAGGDAGARAQPAAPGGGFCRREERAGRPKSRRRPTTLPRRPTIRTTHCPSVSPR